MADIRAAQARKILQGLPQKQRNAFIGSFNTLSGDTDRTIAVDRLIDNFNRANKTRTEGNLISQQSLIPEQVRLGAERVVEGAPSPVRTGLEFAAQTAKGFPLAGGGGFSFAGQQAIDQPGVAATAAGAGIAPLGTGAALGLRQFLRSTDVGKKIKEVGGERLTERFNIPTNPTDVVGFVNKNILGKIPKEVNEELVGAGLEVLAGGGVEAAKGAIKTGVTRLLQPGTKFLSRRIINDLIKPPTKDFVQYGRTPGKEVANLGITGNTLKGFFNNIVTKIDDLMDNLASITSKATKSGKLVNLSKIFKGLDDEIALLQRVPESQSGRLDALLRLRKDLVSNLGTSPVVTPDDALEFKRFLSKITNFTAKSTDDISQAQNRAMRDIYRAVDGALDDVVDGAQPVNNSIANLISARNATIQRAGAAEKAPLLGLLRRITGGSALIGAAAGGQAGSLLGPVGTAAGAIAGEAALTSPFTATRIAKHLARFGTGKGRKLAESALKGLK